MFTVTESWTRLGHPIVGDIAPHASPPAAEVLAAKCLDVSRDDVDVGMSVTCPPHFQHSRSRGDGIHVWYAPPDVLSSKTQTPRRPLYLRDEVGGGCRNRPFSSAIVLTEWLILLATQAKAT
jgi:hypothetical protein